MLILGIESTCDETGVAVVSDGRKVITNFLASSVDLQNSYGGVVPEVAAREQIKYIVPLLQKNLETTDIKNIDAISVAYGPGLIGSLLIGVETAKALSVVLKKPLIPINHLVGHVYSNWLEKGSDVPVFPLVGLIVSGGHTDLVYMKSQAEIEHLGGTIDDAAGEAFDKVAKHLRLPYPGGPQIQRQAELFHGNSHINFPRPLLNKAGYNFSFSGLKTSVANFIDKNYLRSINIPEVSYFFQEAVVDVLAEKTLKAAQEKGVKTVIVGGGVAANKRLREKLQKKFNSENSKIFFPENNFSVDNGAMIAGAAFYIKNQIDPLRLTANPALHFD